MSFVIIERLLYGKCPPVRMLGEGLLIMGMDHDYGGDRKGI